MWLGRNDGGSVFMRHTGLGFFEIGNLYKTNAAAIVAKPI